METPKNNNELIIPKVDLYSYVHADLVGSEESRQGVYVANVGDGTIIVVGERNEEGEGIYHCKADNLIKIEDEKLLPGTEEFIKNLKKANSIPPKT